MRHDAPEPARQQQDRLCGQVQEWAPHAEGGAQAAQEVVEGDAVGTEHVVGLAEHVVAHQTCFDDAA